ncbi:MAG: TrkH family potassium uptake protein [Actinomycetota bacterium]|nr:TrkH family potassium uptake protein [Actinomycetota bacterium]
MTRNPFTYVSGRDVYLIVVLGWFGVASVGSLPFILSGLMGPVDAFFEAMAGFTTTGASTVQTPEEVAPSLLLWRSLTQWAGGIGIVLLFVAVGPLVGFGATQLYSAEVANPVPERLTPRIRDTVKVLAYVYGILTLGGVIMLLLAGMGAFDAVNHALTTVSTGGYSTRSDSIAAFDSWTIELVIAAGMVLSGVNFALYFQAIQGRLGRALGNRELIAYLGIIAAGTVLMTATLYAFDYRDSLTVAFREALFQSASLLTGTAFSTADWSSWDPLSQSLLMLFMAIGGCAGSTSGGVKVVRAVLLIRHAGQEIFRMLHPRAVTPLKLGDRVIPERLRSAFLGFFFVYVAALVAGTLLIALHGVSTGEAFGSVFACLNITGTALGPVGDPQFYADLPASAKLILTFFMLLGRLELFTVLVIFTPAFWRG